MVERVKEPVFIRLPENCTPRDIRVSLGLKGNRLGFSDVVTAEFPVADKRGRETP